MFLYILSIMHSTASYARECKTVKIDVPCWAEYKDQVSVKLSTFVCSFTFAILLFLCFVIFIPLWMPVIMLKKYFLVYYFNSFIVFHTAF